MVSTLQEFRTSAVVFARRILGEMDTLGFSGKYSAVDHICYRTEDLSSYEIWKERICSAGILLSEAYINGRPIASIKLHEPLIVSDSVSIDVIELPAPKGGYKEGFEHIEVVTRSPIGSIAAEFKGLNFNLSNMSAPVNRDISLKLQTGVVKFHESSLEEVIRIEQEQIAASGRKKVAIVHFDVLTAAAGTGSALSCLRSEGVSVVVCREEELSKPQLPDCLGELCKDARVLMLEVSGSDSKGVRHLNAEIFQAAWVRGIKQEAESAATCRTPLDFLDKAIRYFA